MSNSKKIIVLLIILLLVLGISFQVQATNTIDLDDILTNSTTNTTTNEITNAVVNTTTNTTTNDIVQPDTNSEAEAENDLPQTGVTEDITIMFFIIVCAIVAIYAYKKIRDYKS